MRTPTVIGAFTICLLWLGAAGAHAQACEPDGEVQFLCGPVSPEDLALSRVALGHRLEHGR